MIRGINTPTLVTPKILEVAREHYNCPSLPGLPLENEGGYGSIGTHFERSLMNNELMTASISSEAIFSKFTAALLIDSGWYDVDFQLTEPFIYGKKRGCSFVEQVCQDPAKPSEFCYDDQDACTFGMFILMFFLIINFKRWISQRLLLQKRQFWRQLRLCYQHRLGLQRLQDLPGAKIDQHLWRVFWSQQQMCKEHLRHKRMDNPIRSSPMHGIQVLHGKSSLLH